MKKILALMLAAIMLLSLAGCGAKPVPAPSPSPSAEPLPAETPADTRALQPDAEDGVYHVSSVEELVEAIRPGAGITIEPGRYDVTDFLKGFPNPRDWDAWNEEHEYVQISDVYDGLELVVRNTPDLYIKGGSEDPADTEIVIEPRYAAVLNFENCKGLELACLTMGHTDQGDCSGNVLNFDKCRNVYLRTMDLYGCGVYGIGAYNGSGNLYVSNSTIRDCAYGPFEIFEGEGDFQFTACTLAGSDGGGWYDVNEVSQLSFIGCFFGEQESNFWYFDETASFENCEWSEITEYPDYSGADWEFDPETFEELSVDEDMMGDTYWIGYVRVDPQSGETEELPVFEVELTLDEDRSGELAYWGGELDITWRCEDGMVFLESEDGNFYVTVYRSTDEAEIVWLMMQLYNDIVWLY